MSLSIGKYSDKVLCDVIHMHTIHLLLWRYDNLTKKKSLIMPYSFVKDIKKISFLFNYLQNRSTKTNWNLKREMRLRGVKIKERTKKSENIGEAVSLEGRENKMSYKRKIMKYMSFYTNKSEIKSVFFILTSRWLYFSTKNLF